jgi:hypothetical protein
MRFKRPPVKTDQDNNAELDESDEDIDLKTLSHLCGDLTEEIMDSQVEENILVHIIKGVTILILLKRRKVKCTRPETKNIILDERNVLE